MTKLLILEHSKSVRNNLCERLEFEGYATRAVETAAAAEVIASQEPFDLMITDDVEPLVEVDIPLIVISSRPNFDLAVEAMHRGAVDFLTKPIMPEQIQKRSVKPHMTTTHFMTLKNV